MSLTSDARDIGRLLSYALRPRVRPGAGGDYGQLITRYRDDMTFRTAVEAVLDGLDLTVAHAGDLGLYLIPRRESVFAYKISDESGTWNKDTARALRGIAHVGIAAFAYPLPDDLHDPTVRYVDTMKLVHFLRRAIDTLRARAEAVETGQVEVDNVLELARIGGVDTAWVQWEKMPDTDVGTKGRGSGRISQKSATYWALRALRELVDFGLARPVGKESDGRFQLLERYRLQIGKYAVEEGYQALAALRREDSDAPDARFPGVPTPLPGQVPPWAEGDTDTDDFPAAHATTAQLPPTEEEQA